MAQDTRSEVTRAIEAIRRGDPDAAERLWPLVYDELRIMAERRMHAERAGVSLQPTGLVHEVYLRLMGDEVDWRDRAYFFGAAARAMRRILVERARSRGRLKRGGDRERVTLVDVAACDRAADVDLVDLEAAIARLDSVDETKAAIVSFRYLVGLTIEETAEVLGLSTAKVRKDWTFAKAWLKKELRDGD